jgi:2-hydroxychromene-2-carboxylate isomerase
MPMKSLEVYIDYKSPYAYIAKDPTYDLQREFGIEIDWYPLTLNIGSYLGTAKTNNSGKVVENNRSPRQWMAVKYAYMDARRYASLRNLTLKGTQKIWDSSLAAIGMLWVKAQGTEQLKRYTDITFERFWRRDLDIEDIDVVVSILNEAGVNVAGFDAYQQGEGRTVHNALQEEILDKGYFGVPTYVIDGESYFGREHLPRVRWHLSGCPGPIPDVAYDTILKA